MHPPAASTQRSTLTTCFSLAALVGLAGVWAGCSNDDESSGGRIGTPVTLDQDAGGGDAGAPISLPLSAGPYGDPVSIDYGTCARNAKCGGPLVGDWKITGGCLDKNSIEVLSVNCISLKATDFVATAAGTLSFTDTRNARHTKVDVSGTLSFSTDVDQCNFARGMTCTEVERELKTGAGGGMLRFDTATCTTTTTPTPGCSCVVTKNQTADIDQGYQAAGGMLSSENPTRTYDYCLDGAKGEYLETSLLTQDLILHLEIGKQ